MMGFLFPQLHNIPFELFPLDAVVHSTSPKLRYQSEPSLSVPSKIRLKNNWCQKQLLLLFKTTTIETQDYFMSFLKRKRIKKKEQQLF